MDQKHDEAASTPPALNYGGSVHKAVAAYPQQVADVVTNLGFSARDPDELLELLQRCADLAVRVVQGADLAGITAHVAGSPFTAVHTDDRTLEIDRRQYEAGDGPCLHAMRTGTLVRVDVAAGRDRWPGFTADAEAAGVHSFLAAPMGTSAVRLGALNLYSHEPDGFSAADEDLIAVLVDQTVRGIEDYTRLHAAEELARQLQEAIASRAVIEQAKGILMAAHGIDAAAAFDRLRIESQQTNTRLHTLATEFVARHSAPRPGGPSAER